MKKRFLALFTVAMMAVSTLATTVTAAETGAVISKDDVHWVEAGVSIADGELTYEGLLPVEGVEVSMEDVEASVSVSQLTNEQAGIASQFSFSPERWSSCSTRYYYNQLPDNLKYWWDQMVSECDYILNGPGNIQKNKNYTNVHTTPYISTGSRISDDEIGELVFMFQYSNPQYFFLQNRYFWTGTNIGIQIYEDFVDYSDRADAIQKFSGKIEQWQSQITAQTPYGKVKQIHSIMAPDIVYGAAFKNYTSSTTYTYNESQSKTQSAYSAVVYGSTVCAGYTRAFALMCNSAGVETIGVIGTGNGNGKVEDHAWNKVLLEGNWYNVDLTWDDQTYGIIYTYYCKSDSDFVKHYVKPSWVPYQPASNKTLTTELFDDVLAGKWYVDGIRYAYNANIMSGYKSKNGQFTGEFGPNDTLTRAQFATMIYRMSGEPYVKYKGMFSDVPDGKYYSDAVEWCASAGLITGYTAGGVPTGQFGPNDNIQRQQLAVILYRYANYLGYYTMEGSAELDSFPDGGKVGSYARDALQWCVYWGILTGSKDNATGITYLKPDGQATRAECATMIKRFDE